MNPSGGFLRTTLRRFFGSSPALASSRSFSTTCSGARTTTPPVVSNPAPPGPPAVLGQHPAVRHPDAVRDQPGQRLADPGGESEAADQRGDLVLLRAGAD